MRYVKTSVTLPEDIYSEAKEVSGNFSLLVANTLREYLKKVKIEKAIQSFGSWEDREKDSVDIVNELRKDRCHEYID